MVKIISGQYASFSWIQTCNSYYIGNRFGSLSGLILIYGKGTIYASDDAFNNLIDGREINGEKIQGVKDGNSVENAFVCVDDKEPNYQMRDYYPGDLYFV